MSKSNVFRIPKLSLVVLMGASGSGKSTFAQKHFLGTEVLSSDHCRGLVSDDENNQAASKDAFEVLNYIARKRLAAGKLTVIDATNVQPDSRRPLIALAREFHVLPVAIVLNMPEKICVARNEDRSDRNFGSHIIRNHRSLLRRSMRGLKREGFRHIFEMKSPEEVESAVIERVPLWNDKTHVHGPFDFIGDVHGCYDELESLLGKLGYERISFSAAFEKIPSDSHNDGAATGRNAHSNPTSSELTPGWSDLCFSHPQGRQAVFVGDLVDRGPRAVDCLSVVRNMVATQNALCVPGNHDVKLMRKLRGKNVQIKHGLAETLEDLDRIPAEHRESFNKELIGFLDGMVSHYVLDEGRVVVAHAGLLETMQGRGSGKVREFALYGETTGEIDEFGLPVRHNWAADYRGDAMVVYGHTPVPEAEWLNKTIDIDTGCVFGGKLTALRYPEQELVDVPAGKVYCVPAKPLEINSITPGLSAQQINDDLLDADDVIGKRIVSTRLRNNITIREQNSTAALEVMSRFAANPKWLIYLPPTMSPCESSDHENYLEYPTEAFVYFRKQGVKQVVCQEKHMGSRAVIVVCKDETVAQDRFGIEPGSEGQGIVYTRTGRRFFKDMEMERSLLARIATRLTRSGFWETFSTNWVCLDCELMPWSAKAQELLQSQYAAVGAAASQALPAAILALEKTKARQANVDSSSTSKIDELAARFQATSDNVEKFVDAYRQYCWPVNSLDDLKIAPFHVLATEGKVHVDRDHLWHMKHIADFCQSESKDDTCDLLMATRFLKVELEDEASVQAGVDWWLEMTGSGGEGMVVKPFDFVTVTNSKKKIQGSEESREVTNLCQPAVKVRGREYLRIIYGPDYDTQKNLDRLRNRHLGRKRSLAIREFALGVEALERFVAQQPLRKVHECVFGVLALESEPVDPRL